MAILKLKNKTTGEWEEIQAIKGEQGPQGVQGEKGDKGDKGDSGASEWGDIGGTLSNQTDLQTALNNKANTSSVPTKTSQLTNDSGYTTFSGSYNDLTNKPTIPSKTSDLTNDSGFITNSVSDLTNYTKTSDLSAVATSGSYNDLSNKPTIPSKTSDLTNDSGFITSSSLPTKVSDLTNDSGFITNTVNNLTNYYTKTNTYTKSEVDSLISSISSLDIQRVQTLPTRDISTSTIYLVPKTASTNDNYDEYIYVNNSWEHIGSTEVDLSNYYTKTQTDNLLDDKADVSSLSTVATTGSYNDLSNKPTIPTVNNATLTIQKNGTTVKTFTANASSNVTANITVPTKTSDLTNDSGFVDNTYHDSSKQDTLVSGTNIKTINNTSILGNGNISLPQVTDNYSASTTDSYSCNYVNEINDKFNYTQEEQRIGTWINGKPIYRKYLSFNLSTTIIYNDYKHNISDIDYIIKVEGSAYDGREFYIMPAALPSDNVAKYGVVIQSITKTNVHIYSGIENKANNINVKMFVYYTKTTD